MTLLAAVATLSLSASVSAQQGSPEIDAAAQADTIRGRTDATFAPTRAVDHVIVNVHPNLYRLGDSYRFVVTRSGDWLRSERTAEDGAYVAYSNFATGASMRVRRDAAGRLSALNASRYPAADTQHLYDRLRTGERDTLLGEPCEIWRFTPQGDDRRGRYDRGPIWLSCVTQDGVELWSRTLYSNGEVMNSAHAIALERRRVRAKEVRPPADVVRWATWRSDVAPAAQAPNDEVRMVGTSSWTGRGELVIRRRDGWTYRSSRHLSRETELWHEASGLHLRHIAELDGRPLELSIDRPASDPRRPNPASVILNETAIVLGERCTWIDRMPGDPMSNLRECVTRDGIVLWMRGGHMGDTLTFYEYKAVSMRRGGVAARDMEPPRAAFTWLQ